MQNERNINSTYTQFALLERTICSCMCSNVKHCLKYVVLFHYRYGMALVIAVLLPTVMLMTALQCAQYVSQRTANTFYHLVEMDKLSCGKCQQVKLCCVCNGSIL